MGIFNVSLRCGKLMFNHPYETQLLKKKESDFLPLYGGVWFQCMELSETLLLRLSQENKKYLCLDHR